VGVGVLGVFVGAGVSVGTKVGCRPHPHKTKPETVAALILRKSRLDRRFGFGIVVTPSSRGGHWLWSVGWPEGIAAPRPPVG
jgi:hypothetical protein